VTVQVGDDGSPPLTNSVSFSIVVVPPPRLASVNASDGKFVMTWQTFPGKTYRTQFKDDLSQTNWTTLGGDVLVAGSALSFTNSMSVSPQRFFRILQLD
jgi:hypothetical protein